MELMQSIDLDKVIQSLSDKDRKLSKVENKTADANHFMNEVYKAKAKEVANIKLKADKETVLKEVAV